MFYFDKNNSFKRTLIKGLPWLRFLVVKILLPLQGAWVPSLLRELLSHMPHGQKNKNKPKQTKNPHLIKNKRALKTLLFLKKKRTKYALMYSITLFFVPLSNGMKN